MCADNLSLLLDSNSDTYIKVVGEFVPRECRNFAFSSFGWDWIALRYAVRSFPVDQYALWKFVAKCNLHCILSICHSANQEQCNEDQEESGGHLTYRPRCS